MRMYEAQYVVAEMGVRMLVKIVFTCFVAMTMCFTSAVR